jgi:epoxyqueuosine reductase QueG
MNEGRERMRDMELSEKIVSYATSLFDVATFSPQLGGGALLITGLESTAERNLDEFGRHAGEFQLIGFEKHVRERLTDLLDFIHTEGADAELVGMLGYPQKREFNLKEEAVRTGLCKRVKNTLVLHPRYGTRLRFMAIRTNVNVQEPVQTSHKEEESPLCGGCRICIDACPVNVLEPYRMSETAACLSNISRMPEERERLIPCDLCVHLCPLNRK